MSTRKRGSPYRKDGTPTAKGNVGNRKQQLTPARERTAVARHPDREMIETLLTRWSAYRVQRWLDSRYPIEGEGLDPAEGRRNKKLRITRNTLVEYRTKYLVDDEKVWREPIEDSPLESVLPPRIPHQHMLWELDALEAVYQAHEFVFSKCLETDRDMGMVQEITLLAAGQLRDTARQIAELKMRLGMPGYEEAARKVQMDQTVRGVHIHARAGGGDGPAPDDKERLALARRLLELGPGAHDVMDEAERTIPYTPPVVDEKEA